MSYCINTNSFDTKNISIGKTSDYNGFKINKIYYKYDFNLSKEFKLLTGFINVKYLNYKFNGIKFTIESLELKNILKYIESIIPKENVTTVIKSNIINSSSESDFTDDSDYSESDSEEEPKLKEKIVPSKLKEKIVPSKLKEKIVPSKLKEKIVPSKSESDSESDEEYNKQDNKEDKEDNIVEIYFKNNKSELKLNPTKKSSLDTYILTKNENYNQIKNYFPYINKYGISGNFILYLSVVNGKIKFYIESGELKHPMSFTKRDTTIKNVYDTKVVIDI